MGEAQQMFEGDNIYVVHERAIVDKIYSFICPSCHSVFISKTINDEVVKIKCPECDTYICFSSQGERPNTTIRRTQIISGNDTSKLEGILVWSNNGLVESKVLTPGEITIGRKSNDLPYPNSGDTTKLGETTFTLMANNY